MFSLRKTADLIIFLLICPLPWIFFVQSGFLLTNVLWSTTLVFSVIKVCYLKGIMGRICKQARSVTHSWWKQLIGMFLDIFNLTVFFPQCCFFSTMLTRKLGLLSLLVGLSGFQTILCILIVTFFLLVLA